MPRNPIISPWSLATAQRVDASMLSGYRQAMERFARAWSKHLSVTTGAQVAVTAHETEVQAYADCAEQWTGEHCLNVLRSDGLRCPGLIALDAGAAFALTACHLGGAHAPTNVSTTGPIPLARATLTWRIAKRTATSALEEITRAVAAHVTLAARCTRQEAHLDMVSLMPETEVAIVTSFTLDVGGSPGRMHLVWPLAAWREALTRIGRPAASELDDRFAAALSANLGQVEIELTGVLGRATVLTRDLLALEIGDILQLATDADQPLELHAEGVMKMRARAGVSRGRRALKIVS